MDDSVLEHYRRDQRREVMRVLGWGGFFVAVGSLVVGFALHLRHGHRPGAEALIALGVLIVGIGPVSTLLRMQRLLSVEQFLAIRRRGLLYCDNQVEVEIDWDDIVVIRLEAGQVLVERRSAPSLTVTYSFDGIGPAELARHLEHLRKKAGMNLLKGGS